MNQAQCPFCNFIMVNSHPGQVVSCPSCGSYVQMPPVQQQAYAPTGQPIAKTHAPQERDRGIPKSPGAAAVLSFLIPGAGQLLNGQIGKGLLIFFLLPPAMIASVVLILLVSSATAPEFGILIFGVPVVWFCLWVWQVVDAYSMADRYNRRHRFK